MTKTKHRNKLDAEADLI